MEREDLERANRCLFPTRPGVTPAAVAASVRVRSRICISSSRSCHPQGRTYIRPSAASTAPESTPRPLPAEPTPCRQRGPPPSARPLASGRSRKAFRASTSSSRVGSTLIAPDLPISPPVAPAEDLFRGSFAQPPQQPSASFAPLSVARADSQSHTPAVRTRARAFSGVAPPLFTPILSQARPRSPADPHPASRGGRRSPATIATRSHPHSQPSPQALRASTTTASTPPPADYSCTSSSTADAALQQQQHVRSWRPPPGTDREPERPVDLGHPSRYAHPPRSAHRDALGSLSLAPAPRGNPSYEMPPSAASPSHLPRTIQSPADELVSILTRARGLQRTDSAGADSRTRAHGPRHMPYGPGPSMAPAPVPIPTHAPYYPHAHAHAGRPGPSTGGAPAASVAAGPGKARYPQQHSAAAATGVGAGGARGKASASAADDSERRHCCPHCNKRFNRPSSLAIHVNTHTGAKRTYRRRFGLHTGGMGS